MNKISQYILKKLKMSRADERKRQGIFAGLVGIFVNFFLFAAKIFIGLLSGSVAVIADAFNNLSDMGTSIVMILGFKISAQPADKNHPFGYGRAEYIAGVFVSAAIIFVGIDLLVTSIKNVYSPQEIFISNGTFIILLISIAAKIFLAMFYKNVGKKIYSETIEAAATDSLNDCLTTGVVFITMAIYKNSNVNADGIAGIFVAGLILYSGWKALQETSNPLIGNAPPPELVTGIKDTVMNNKKILGIHDLIIHNYGSSHGFASLHVEMSAELNLLEAHEIIDKIERRLRSNFNLTVIVHIDPVVDTPEFDQFFVMAMRILNSVDDRLTLHDFRVEKYKTGHKFIFDVVVPQEILLTDREIRKKFLRRLLSTDKNLRALIHFDHQYC